MTRVGPCSRTTLILAGQFKHGSSPSSTGSGFAPPCEALENSTKVLHLGGHWTCRKQRMLERYLMMIETMKAALRMKTRDREHL
jgi:hypothetical protein